MKKTFGIIGLLLLLTVSFALAEPPTVASTVPEAPFTVVEGEEIRIEIHGEDPDGNNDFLRYGIDNAGRDAGVEVTWERDENNDRYGVYTWTPLDTQDLTFWASIFDGDGERTNVQYTIEVSPALEVSNLIIEGELVGEEFRTEPGEELDISFDVTNHASTPITGIQASFVNGDDAAALFEETNQEPVFNGLNPGQTRTVDLESVVFVQAAGEQTVIFGATGKDFESNRRNRMDNGEFQLVVERETADLVLQDIELPAEVTCAVDFDVTYKVTNLGSSVEDDVEVVIEGDSWESTTRFEDALRPGESFEGEMRIPSSVLETGNNQFDITVQYRDGFLQESDSFSITKNTCLSDFKPRDVSLEIRLGDGEEFEIETEGRASIEWYINGLLDERSRDQEELDFTPREAGDYEIRVVVNSGEEVVWDLHVTQVPLSSSGLLTSNVGEDDDLEDFEELRISSTSGFGNIFFEDDVDVSFVDDLDDFFIVADPSTLGEFLDENDIEGFVDDFLRFAYYSSEITDEEALFTLQGIPQGEVTIFNIDEGDFEVRACGPNDCTNIKHQGTTLTFEGEAEDLYAVKVDQPANLVVGEISFEDVTLGENAETTFTVQNTGTKTAILNLAFDLSGIGDQFSAEIVGQAPTTLAPGADAQEVTLRISVPSNQPTGERSIGPVVTTYTVNGEELSKSTDATVSPQTFLKITKIELDGKESGKFKIEEENDFEITVENTLDIDMENVFVEVTILDVDNDDLEEESDEEDINAGDDEKFDVTFDFAGENLDDTEFDVEFKVEGEDEDGNTHEVTETKTFRVDLESHDLRLQRASLSSSTLRFLDTTSVEVDIKNYGKQDEEDVVVRVTNTKLGIDEKVDDIEVDEFGSSGDDESETIRIKLDDDVKPGTYDLKVELFRDNTKLEDTKVLQLTVVDGSVENSVETSRPVQNAPSEDTLADFLAQQLAERNAAENVVTGATVAEDTTVSTSFRDSDSYIALLGVLGILVFIALVLALAVIMKK